MAYFYLLVAACFEAGWPIGMKLAALTGQKVFYLSLAAGAMMLSGWFLYLAQRVIPIGTAYCWWTGTGCIAVMLISCLFFAETFSGSKALGMICIIGGMVLLELSAQNS